jgi:hypothetical protein
MLVVLRQQLSTLLSLVQAVVAVVQVVIALAVVAVLEDLELQQDFLLHLVLLLPLQLALVVAED